jgi:hypothetical protein
MDELKVYETKMSVCTAKLEEDGVVTITQGLKGLSDKVVFLYPEEIEKIHEYLQQSKEKKGMEKE